MLKLASLMTVLLFVQASSARASARASDQPVVTLAQGEVTILSAPRAGAHDSVPAGFSRSKFEGKFYLSKKAIIGDAVALQSWVRTMPGARARLVYPNGDQLNVGPGSFFSLEMQKGAKAETLNFEYGMVRSIISKSGPRSGFRVRTPSAVMGVRGTDFVIEELAGQKATSLTLIRGAVSLQPNGVKVAQEVKTGETAIAESAKAPEKFATSQTELKRALVLTEKSKVIPAESVEVPSQVAEQVKKLEAQARETTVKDVVQYAATPEEKARLQKIVATAEDVQAINAAAVQLRVEQAPKDSPGLQRIIEETRKTTKRTEVDLRELEKDPYQKYFDSTQ